MSNVGEVAIGIKFKIGKRNIRIWRSGIEIGAGSGGYYYFFPWHRLSKWRRRKPTQGEPIPKHQVKNYAGKYWKREIGVEDQDKYDGVYYYECPDCKGTWAGYRALK